MELHDYFRIVRKQSWLIILAVPFCLAAAAIASLATTPVYQGRAKLLVVAKTDPRGGTASAYEGALLSQQLTKSFAQIITSRATAEAALRLDPQPFTSLQLQDKIHAEPVTNTLLIDLSVEDTDAARAKRLTNSVARAFIRTVPNLQSGSALHISLVEPALTPTKPIRPQTRLNLALGLVVGLISGVGLGFLRELLDRSIKTPEELEEAVGAPVVGLIPPFKANKEPIPVAEQPRTITAEAFRKLRTNFAFLNVDRGNVCCVITSPGAGDGKSTVTANLGIALVQAGHRVVILDADLRRPTLHTLFRLQQRVGTTTLLLDRASVGDAIQFLGRHMPEVITSGQLPPNPSELLGSRRMGALVAELRNNYDIVLIDCAPLLPVTDPMVVSQYSDGIILIARAGITSRDQAQAAKSACTKAGATLFGTVLNASSVLDADQSAYSTYYDERPRQNNPVDIGIDLVANNGSRKSRIEADRASRHRRIRSGSR